MIKIGDRVLLKHPGYGEQFYVTVTADQGNNRYLTTAENGVVVFTEAKYFVGLPVEKDEEPPFSLIGSLLGL